MPGLDLTLDMDLGLQGYRKPRRRTEQLQPVQQQSLMSKVGNAALGGIAAVGGVLDLPGSSVRDVLAGQNPFDQYLSPFNPDKNRVSGRDLLRKTGMVGQKDTWGNWAGGLAAEIALDPTTYLGIGALGKAGQFAKGAGVLDDVTKVAAKKASRTLGQMGHREAKVATTIEDLMTHGGDEVVQKLTSHAQRTGKSLDAFKDQKLGGLFGLNLPFAEPFAAVGTGKTAEKVARGIDTAGRAIRYAKIPGTDFQPVNSVANLFDRAGEGMKTPEGRARQQELLRAQEANRAATRGVEAQLAVALEKAGLGTQASAKFVRQVLEDPRTVSEATRVQLKKAIQDIGALPDDQQAEAVSQLYKQWAEGYLGEDLAATLQRTMDPQFAVKDAPLPTGTLPQEHGHSPEFQKWFGGSKVVDDKGVPLTVYHGTSAPNFQSFDDSRIGETTGNTGFFGRGHYFSDDPQTASFYAGFKGATEPSQRVYPVNLAIQNPLMITRDPGDPLGLLKPGLLPDPVRAATVSRVSKWAQGIAEDVHDGLAVSRASKDKAGKEISDAIREAAIENGYDGVIATVKGEREFVAFHPTQIKSVNNRGTFDATDPNILHQMEWKQGVPPKIKGTGEMPPILPPAQTLDEMVAGAPRMKQQADMRQWKEPDPAEFYDPNLSQIVEGQPPRVVDHGAATQSFSRTPPSGPSVPTEYPGLGDVTPPPKGAPRWLEQAAHHGSPHIFDPVAEIIDQSGHRVRMPLDQAKEHGLTDLPGVKTYPHGKFDLSRMGTGEGAQMFGYGHYAAESESLAKKYRKDLSQRHAEDAAEHAREAVTYATDEISWQRSQYAKSAFGPQKEAILDKVKSGEIDLQEASQKLHELDKQAASAFEATPQYKELSEKLVKANAELNRLGSHKGALYNLNLKPADDEWLLWDKPLSQQSEKVKEALKKAVPHEPVKWTEPGAGAHDAIEPKGVEVYNGEWRIRNRPDLGTFMDGYYAQQAFRAANAIWESATSGTKQFVAGGDGMPLWKIVQEPGGQWKVLEDGDDLFEMDNVLSQVALSSDSALGRTPRMSEVPTRFATPEEAMQALEKHRTEYYPTLHGAMKGEEIYKKLGSRLGSDKAASEALYKAGVKGNKYLDRQSRRAGKGTHNYVVFSDDDIEITNRILDQLGKNQTPNAAVMFKENGKALLHTFTGKTNVTSHIHEFGHIARRHLKDADQAIANTFVGAKDANWTVQQEEKFARGLERYLRDGHASSPALKGLFAQIKQWMLDTYRALTGSPLAVSLTPEIKALYGKLIDSPSKLPMSPAALQGLPPEVLDIVGKAHKLKDDALSIAQELGVGPKRLKDPEVSHFPRFLSAGLRNAGAVGGGMPFSTESPSRQSRKLMYEGIKGGTATLQTIAQDPGLNILIDGKASKKSIAKYIKNTFGQDVPEKFLDARTRKELRKAGTTEFTPAVVQQFGRNRYKALASNLANMSPETRKSGIFGNHPLADLQTSTLGLKNAASAAKQTFDFLAQPGTLKPASEAARNVDTVRVGSVFKKLGIEKTAGLKQLADRTGLAVDDLADMRVDKAQAQDLLTTRKGFEAPSDPSKLMQAVDSATNFIKGMFTGPWPAFHTRNLTSGQTQNALAGLFSPDSVKDGGMMLFGKTVPAAAQIPVLKQMAAERGIQSLDDKTATELLRELAYAHGIVGKHEGLGTAAAGKAAGMKGTSIEDILGGLPGHRPFSVGNVAKKAIGRAPGTNLNPLNVRGVGGKLESSFGPMAAAEDVGYLVEGMNRLSPFIMQLRQGIEPAEAAKRIGEVQVSYANRNFTKFEQGAMARAFPFYKFTRKQLGHTAAELASKPGGRLAQGIRAVNRSRKPNELTPDYVAETASIPLGENEDGSKRYITGLGLAPEDPLSFMQPDAQAVGLEALSRLNPMLKGPLEYATGQSFFQRGQNGGRPIDDLDPTLGRIMANVTGRDKAVTFPGSQAVETALSNSPLARALTTVRTATDRRKSLGTKASQILTGVRVSDISPAAQDAVLRDRMAQLERELGSKTFVKRYFPKEVLDEMSPEQRKQAEEINALRKILEQRAKARAQNKEQKKS